MDRRHFIGSLASGSVGVSLVDAGVSSSAPEITSTSLTGTAGLDARDQALHPDAQTDIRGVEYFFLGNGTITAVIQHAEGPALEKGLTPLGLMIWDPHHFSRKWSTYTFHPEWGLKRGMLTITAGEHRYSIGPDSALQVCRIYPDGVPVVEAFWMAGPLSVRERFWVSGEEPVLRREVFVSNPSGSSIPVSIGTSLYYSHALFSAYVVDHRAQVLRADGYAHLELFSEPPGILQERFVTVDVGSVDAGGTVQVLFTYLIRMRREEVDSLPVTDHWKAAQQYWSSGTTLETGVPDLNHLYLGARNGLRAVISDRGRFDASVWQYGLEWVMDASQCMMAALRSGQFELAHAILDHTFTDLVSENGMAMQASRFRGNLDAELNQNGALLGAVWTYAAWTGDLELIQKWWPKIVSVAEFPLQPRFLHESGMVQTEVEFFERTGGFGILDGFELGYQALIAWGLEKASELASAIGDKHHAERWQTAGARMQQAMLNHPTLALVEDGALIKRRTVQGAWQKTLIPRDRGMELLPEGMPLSEEDAPLLDPDVTVLYPILLGQIDAKDPIVEATLDRMNTLWNLWDTGGYPRYHPSGEPDSPGPWPFASGIVARALAEASREREVRRVLDWFSNVQGGRGGSYLEFYYTDNPRPVPPLPPTGIIVWAWAELVSLYIEQLLGVRPELNQIRLNPHLPEGVNRMQGNLRIRDSRVKIDIQRKEGPTATLLNGKPVRPEKRGFVLPYPIAGGTLDINLTI